LARPTEFGKEIRWLVPFNIKKPLVSNVIPLRNVPFKPLLNISNQVEPDAGYELRFFAS
jgi:hypothetical protein